MKILFIANQVPYPPDNGVRIVSFHAMRLMHQAGHQLALTVLSDEKDYPEERFKCIAKFCENGMAWMMALPIRHPLRVQWIAIKRNMPFFVERFRSEPFIRKLIHLIDQFKPNVIHFDTIAMAQYREFAPKGVGTVASINDCCALSLENSLAIGKYNGLEHVYRFFQSKQVRFYESSVYAKFNRVHVMSETDARYLVKLNPKIVVSVIPNGVEETMFGLFDENRNQFNLIFVGSLIDHNLLALNNFLKHGWPIVRNAFPELEFYVVGNFRAEAKSTIDVANKIGNVKFLGYVKDVKDTYRKCGIAIVPIAKNYGLINKAIEAMAAGLAVVGFDAAFSGIPEGASNTHFVSVNDYQSMGHEIVKLLKDKSRMDRIRYSACELASRFYSWKDRAASYSKMYEAAAEEANRTMNERVNT